MGEDVGGGDPADPGCGRTVGCPQSPAARTGTPVPSQPGEAWLQPKHPGQERQNKGTP